MCVCVQVCESVLIEAKTVEISVQSKCGPKQINIPLSHCVCVCVCLERGKGALSLIVPLCIAKRNPRRGKEQAEGGLT